MEINELIAQMTLREKIGQLLQVNASVLDERGGSVITGPYSEIELTEEEIFQVGSILNSNGAAEAARIQKNYLQKSRLKIPLLIMHDVIHGYRTIYPINLALAGSFDMSLIEECSAMAAKEAALNGIRVTFAPMLDVARDARWGRVMETCGEDTYLAEEIAKACVRGFQGDLGPARVAACFKHFAAYGAAESGKDYNTVDMSERTLREYYLPPYRAAVEAGAKAAMASFNVFDGVPMAANRKLLQGVLRDEWGFDGVIIRDYAALWEEITHGFAENEEQAALASLSAGLDIEMVSTAYLANLENLVEQGKISEKVIDRAVARVLRLKQDLNLFDDPIGITDERAAKAICLCPEHRHLAKRAAIESAVLLKNEGVLPFDRAVKRVAVIGPFADTGEILGNWSCCGNTEEAVGVAEGIRNVLPHCEISIARGCRIDDERTDAKMLADAAAVAESADAVVLCLGEAAFDSGEGNSRQFLDLSSAQTELAEAVLSANPNTAVVLFTGRPLAIRRLHERAAAILNLWFPGTEGGNAAAELLFGYASPSGKLAMCFPYSAGQCPVYYNHYNTGRPRLEDDRRTAYTSSYIDGPNRPLYPFGYGLSYTKFLYEDLQLDRAKMKLNETLQLSVTVRNAGERDGTEIVQLYLCDRFGSTVRPVRELKGFQRVFLAAGEAVRVSFMIDAKTLAFYGADLQKKAEAGLFTAYVGGDSEATLSVDFELAES